MRLGLSDYKVCVTCMTYNQSKYIVDAMNGFCGQKTTFPFVCVIVDDASKDGEREVIDNYVKMNFDLQNDDCVKSETEDYSLIFARHKSNNNCYFAVFYLKYNHYSIKKNKRDYYSTLTESSKYIACCEGDDFWCGSDFLQEAVSFLDENEDYSAVFGNKLVSDESGNIISKVKFYRDLSIHDIMRGNNMGIRNLCFRKECLYVHPFETSFRDLHIYYKCAVSGKMKYVDRDFAVYRLTGEGVYTKLKEKDVIRTSLEHYYIFHKTLNFKYQRLYVEYQMRKLPAYIGNKEYRNYCMSLISQYHVPSSKRYVWYMLYLTRIFAGWVKVKLFK